MYNIDRAVLQAEQERTGRVYFHQEQIQWIEKMFPEPLHTPASTPAEMYYQSGIRRVVAVMKDKVQQ